MPKKLSKGWIQTTLDDICARVVTIRPEDSPDTEFTYFDIGGIDNQSNRIIETKTVIGRNAPSRARQSVRKNDILFSTVRTYLKKIARIERDYPNPVASTGFIVIRAVEGVSPQFLFLQVLSEDFLQPVHALQTGTSYPAVRDKDVFAQPIRLAPTREQERIVEKLDALLLRVSAGEAAARRALSRLQRYRAAVLQAAATGELTRHWRKIHKLEETGTQLLKRLLHERHTRWEEAELKHLRDSGRTQKKDVRKTRYQEPVPPQKISSLKLPATWAWASPEQLSDGTKYALSIGPFGSNLKVSDYRDSGIPLIFVRSIRSEVFSGKNTKYVSSRKAQELVAHQVVGGDVLITKMGDPPGEACIYPETAPPAIITADCIRLHLLPPLKSVKHFFVYCINSGLGRNQVRHITSGVAQQKVSLSRFASIELPLPPIEEQKQIVREVARRLASADRLATILSRQLERAHITRQSLLREAFTGKLVSQNPDDEPASVLLERIRTDRKIEIKEPQKKRMPKSKLKSVETLDQLEILVKALGKRATPERLLLAAGLGDDVEKFFDLLRTAHNKGSLIVPIGKGTAIKKV